MTSAVRTRRQSHTFGWLGASLAPSQSGADRFLLILLFVAPTILQRFAMPFASGKVSVCFVWFYAVLALLIVTRQNVVIDAGRLILYLAFFSVALVTTFLNRSEGSILSLLLLLLTYAPLILRLDLRTEDYLTLMRLFQGVVVFIVMCGALQFASQFVLGQLAMFPFDLVLSENLFVRGYNLRIPVVPGAPVLKSTGLWLLEPSHFSQTAALALVIELLLFRRFLYIAVFGLGMFLSFSGTGIFLLLVIGPLIVIKRRNPLLIVLAVFGGIAVMSAGEAMFVKAFTQRVETFGDDQSSAYARFIAPFLIFSDMVREGSVHLLFGYGGGTTDLALAATDYESHDTSWLKLTYEYGVLGAVSFLALLCYSLFKGAPSFVIALALLFDFLILGGYLISPYVAFVIVLLGAWSRLSDGVLSPARRPHSEH